MERARHLALIPFVAMLLVVCPTNVWSGDDPRMANREALASDLMNLALRAQDFYHRSGALGGGQGSFTYSHGGVGISTILQLTSKPTNANGSYMLGSVSASSVVLVGIGTEEGTNGSPICVTMTVFADSTALTFNN
ncbi:MAG: hypothetical protein AAB393_00265 [Bacteroidota bacterium]